MNRFLQKLVETHAYETARNLLNEDLVLRSFVKSEAQSNLKTLRDLVSAVDLLFTLNKIIFTHNGSTYTPWSELYILAMSNMLSNSGLITDTLISLKRSKSNVLQECFNAVQEVRTKDGPHIHVVDSVTSLTNLMAQMSDDTVLRSGYDIQHSNLRTTIVAQKVELSRHAAKITADEAAYTKIVDDFVAKVELFFKSSFVNPQQVLLHEVFIYDVKTLHREVFMPRPRFAIERALSSPHDYLGCICCDSAAEGLSASQPATSIVYQLYLESGNVINTADLWSAFWTIVGPAESGNEDEEREIALALFSRALAELIYLGIIKNSRKKADHLAKLSWKGL